MNKEVTMEDPEIRTLYEQVLKSAEASKKREDLSNESFKLWLFETVTIIAQKFGYYIQDLAVFISDMNYCIKKGFKEGREEAKRRSIRNYNNEGDELI